MLCDANRLVRQRAAAAIVRRSDKVHTLLENVVALNDNYGLQALLSELDRKADSEPILTAMPASRQMEKAIERARAELTIESSGQKHS